MLKRFATVDGLEIFAERRRYSNCTFTWLYAKVGDELKDLGDPWPCVTPKRAEVERAVFVLKNTRYVVVTQHGEGETIYHVVDSRAPEGEQPAILESFTTRDGNSGACSQAHYRAACANGFGYKPEAQSA